ncbi:MAG: alpha/beta fold hydrolase [Candidatus Heimdallarchaeota archaeon]|nr:alpha/beta fold hydrolase [Candidatus Heimdallarchaeota archaeon]
MDLQALRDKCQDDYKLIQSKDGTKLFLRDWSTNESKTAFLIMHGITAHSQPYEVIAKPISEQNFSVYGLDLRGHGLSEGPRGDYKSKDQFFEDISSVLDFIKVKHDKIVLIGHSLGVVSSVMISNRFKIDGLVLLSAAREVRDGVYPKRPLTTTLKILIWSLIKPAKPVIHYYREGIRGQGDPHFNFHYTLRFLKVISAANFSFPEKIEYPVFVGIGDNDELFAIDAAKKLYEEVPSEIKQFSVLENCQHAFFGENSFDPLFNWINKTYKS